MAVVPETGAAHALAVAVEPEPARDGGSSADSASPLSSAIALRSIGPRRLPGPGASSTPSQRNGMAPILRLTSASRPDSSRLSAARSRPVGRPRRPRRAGRGDPRAGPTRRPRAGGRSIHDGCRPGSRSPAPASRNAQPGDRCPSRSGSRRPRRRSRPPAAAISSCRLQWRARGGRDADCQAVEKVVEPSGVGDTRVHDRSIEHNDRLGFEPVVSVTYTELPECDPRPRRARLSASAARGTGAG